LEGQCKVYLTGGDCSGSRYSCNSLYLL